MTVHNTPAIPIIRGQSVAALDQEYSVPPQLMPIKNNVVLVVLIVIPAQSMESSRSLIVVLGQRYRTKGQVDQEKPPPGCPFNDEPSDDRRNVASESETKLQVTLVLCSLTEGNDVAQNYQIER